ncbi:MAG: DUF2142 domain-containing protein [Eubacterium sp.]|nr:DUF2142 domain-containing protein [Eubacterium sp.]
MLKKYALPAVITIILMIITGVHASARIGEIENTAVKYNMSFGEISDLPFSDETEYNGTLRIEKGALGISFRMKYPAGLRIGSEAAVVTVTDSGTGETLYNDSIPLSTLGYYGDRANEGAVEIPFSNVSSDNTELSYTIKGSGILPEEEITLRVMADSSRSGDMICGSEPVIGHPYGSIYVMPDDPDTSPEVKKAFIAEICILLLAALYFFMTRGSSNGRLSGHGETMETHDGRNAFSVSTLLDSAKTRLLSIRPRKDHIRSYIKKAIPVILVPVILAVSLEFGYTFGAMESLYESVDYNLKSRLQEMTDLEPGGEMIWSMTTSKENFSGIGIRMLSSYDENARFGLEVYEPLAAETSENAAEPDGSKASSKSKASAKSKDAYEPPAAGAILAHNEFTAEDLITPDKDGFREMILPSTIQTEQGTELIIKLKYISGEQAVHIAASREEGVPYVSGIYYGRSYLPGRYHRAAVFLVIVSVIIMLLAAFGAKPAGIHAAALIALGICMVFLNNPMSVPDEYYHMDEAYRLSNRFLGVESSVFPDAMYKRSCDVWSDMMTKQEKDHTGYSWEDESPGVWSEATEEDQELVLVYARKDGTGAGFFYYLPQALGITLGRKLGYGYFGMFYLGRLANFLAFALLAVIAARRTPIAGSFFAVLSMMPMTLQETASFSYDSMTIAFAFCAAAFSFRLIADERPGAADAAAAGAFVLLSGLNKGGAYIPVGILALAALFHIIKSRTAAAQSAGGDASAEAGTKSSRGPAFLRAGRKIPKAYILIGILIIAACLFIVFMSYGRLYIKDLFGEEGSSFSTRKETELYTLGYMFAHPSEAFRMTEGTIYWRFMMLLKDIAGASLGWLYKIDLSPGLQTINTIILALAVLKTAGEKRLSVPIRIICAIAFILSAAACSIAMLTGWTRFGMLYVDGLQIRYFIPLLPLLAAAIQPNSIAIPEKWRSRLIIMAYLAGAAGFASMMVELF